MRAISPTAQSRAAAAAQRLVWTLELTHGAWRWRAASRALSIAAEPWPAVLAAVERWREALPDGAAEPGGRATCEAEVRLLDVPGSGAALRDRLAVTPPLAIEATLRLGWLDAAAAAGGALEAAAADFAVMLRGRVTRWRTEPLGVRLQLEAITAGLRERRLGRLLRPEMIGGLNSPALGSPLPWIFGRVEAAELVPLRAGTLGRLARAVTAEDVYLPLESLSGFPPQGRVQLGSEQIEYISTNPGSAWLGTPAAPISRGAVPRAWPAGMKVRLVPPEGFSFLVADHACQAVEAVRAEGISLSTAFWSASRIALGGCTAQIVTMPRWPLTEDLREATTLTARVRGWMNAAGELASNPADVIAALLTDPRLGALSPARLDTSSFAAARAELDSRGYAFARRLSGGETLGEALDQAAREAGLWLGAGEPIALTVIDPEPRAARVVVMLDASLLLATEPAAAAADVLAPSGGQPPDALELIGEPRGDGRGRLALQFPLESVAAGAVPRRIERHWLDLAGSAAATDHGELLWSHAQEPPFACALALPPGLALLSPGATVRLSHGALELDQALGWVTALEAGPGARVRLEMRGPWAGRFAWRLDDATWLRAHAFGGVMTWMFDGRPVARLTRGGTLRLAGRLREQASLALGPQPSPVARVGGALVFGAGGAGGYQPFLSIDASGDAVLAGRVRERVAPRPPTAAGELLEATAGGLRLSCDGLGGALEFDAAEAALNLGGIVIESLRL